VPGEEGREPALSLAAAAGYLRRPQQFEAPVDDKLPFAGRMIPVNARGEMLVNYLASPQRAGGIVNFSTVSFSDVLNQEVDPALFRDKVVLIGATASGMGDTFLTPMGVMKSGVELHAIALHTILEANFLQLVPPAITIMLIIVLVLVCGVAVLYFKVLMAALVTVLLVAAYFLSAFFLFDRGMVLNMTYPPLAIAGTFMGVNLYQVISERSEKRVITETFGRYLSPQVVEKILDSLRSGELELGGSEHDVTVAFADVRGFTSISEKTPPAALVTALNTYLSAVIDAVIEQGGMVNKFGGDSVMAVWNAPVASPEHALLAIKAAINAQNAVSALRMDDRSLAGMEFGIGINSGRALAGNMGSQDRLEYSVVGDTVNTAARLADAAPGGRVWIGADTFALVEEHIVATPLPPLTLRGKSQPVQAYEVVEVKSG
jgi:adenylate cyclase